ncbi:LacI family DNA-binding transcriptional regulator [Streptomyces sp. DH41]|uniref:LacI family DNA-binding transcriptional regulator n=1 Tax=Streptomyces sp. DH41 TaxID=3040125 RepID=UPI002442967F|nr:LacI family DNA-binding transcriptional regulator [Streptomyces sp. DH41]MDG9724365.1 LacI family DNA-binding transcriptional regulator [Streptomyces sp. DH41]
MKRPSKRVTSGDVARAAGVSQTTVSFVLNNRLDQGISDETRSKVLEAVRSLGYRPRAAARTLASGRSNVVLLLLSGLPVSVSMSVFIEEFGASLSESGLTLVTHLASPDRGRLVDVCATVHASAVIALSPLDQGTVEAFRESGAQVVLTTGKDASVPDASIGRLQAEYLVGQGHRRLGYGLPTQGAFSVMAEGRLRAVADVCAEHGLVPPVALPTELSAEGAARAVGEWTRRSVTAVCAFNDEVALAVLAGMRVRGLSAPEDVAVVGVDDVPVAAVAAPSLTTVAFDLKGAGHQLAAAVVAGLAQGDPHIGRSGAQPRLIRRQSA